MEKKQLIERAKMYLRFLENGVHPVTGAEIRDDSVIMDEKVKKCFSFIIQTLDDYMELSERVEKLEKEKSEQPIPIPKKQNFSITREQCENIKLSKQPISLFTFMKSINSVVNTEAMEKLSSARITKWLTNRGLISASKVQTVINKTVYKPSEAAAKIGIFEEQVIDNKSGEVKTQVKFGESAQWFILENMEDILRNT